MVYAFALQYFRLHSAGHEFRFDIREDLRFTDFISLSIGVSTAGALLVASATTRDGLSALKTHAIIALVFNIMVMSILVSILAGFINS